MKTSSDPPLLQTGKLYRLKKATYLNGQQGKYDVGTILLLVDYDTYDLHVDALTFVLPWGEIKKIHFAKENIPRYLELCK